MSTAPEPNSSRLRPTRGTTARASKAELGFPPRRKSLFSRFASALTGTARGRMVILGIAAFILFQVWLTVMAPGKISEGIDMKRNRHNLLVTLSFPPERFHVLFFQRYGRVSGTEGNTIEVRGVPLAEMTRVARPYWVRQIEPLKD